MKAGEIPKIPTEELATEVSRLLKKEVLEVKNNFYISLAVVLSGHKIPTRMYRHYASKIGKELSRRKQLKNSKGTP